MKIPKSCPEQLQQLERYYSPISALQRSSSCEYQNQCIRNLEQAGILPGPACTDHILPCEMSFISAQNGTGVCTSTLHSLKKLLIVSSESLAIPKSMQNSAGDCSHHQELLQQLCMQGRRQQNQLQVGCRCETWLLHVGVALQSDCRLGDDTNNC